MSRLAEENCRTDRVKGLVRYQGNSLQALIHAHLDFIFFFTRPKIRRGTICNNICYDITVCSHFRRADQVRPGTSSLAAAVFASQTPGFREKLNRAVCFWIWRLLGNELSHFAADGWKSTRDSLGRSWSLLVNINVGKNIFFF